MLIITSCENKFENRSMVIGKKDGEEWQASAMIYCDSVNMITKQHAKYWIDGHVYNIKGDKIIIASNPNFNQKK